MPIKRFCVLPKILKENPDINYEVLEDNLMEEIKKILKNNLDFFRINIGLPLLEWVFAIREK